MRFLLLSLLFACTPPITSKAPTHEAVPLTELRPGVWMHRSWGISDGVRYEANGLLVGSILIDTPWSPEQTQALLEQARVDKALVTHSHLDRVAGIDLLSQRGIASYGLARTQIEARAHQRPAPTHAVGEEGELAVGDARVIYFFPGAAHAPDNLVVYVPSQQVLFGGCMVRALDAQLGNLGDADIKSWQQAIQRVSERFPEATLIVPGHGEPGGRELLAHTRALVDAALADEVP
ncbi:MAG TPA: subclass B1 metallo-beta-lactamase [Polyangiales bacterium]